MDVVIRAAIAGDAALLARLAERTFVDTFAADNDPADIAAHVASSFGIERQLGEIRDPDVRTLLAFAGDDAAGFAQLRRRPPPSCVRSRRAIEVWRFYVEQAWHGRGVAGALMNAALLEAASLGGDAVWLGVWEKNPRAIHFYRRAGFVDVGTHVFRVGGDAQTDRVMEMSLSTRS